MRLKGVLSIPVLFLLLLPSSLFAGHLYGGEITWECSGGDQVFHLTLYRDCDGSAAPSSAQLEVYRHPSVNSISLTLDSVHDISPSCEEVPGSPSEIQCGSGGGGAVEAAVFSSSPINLTGTPPPDGWVFAWSGQTRSSGPSNLLNPASQGITVRSKMYGPPSGVSPCSDASPSFPEPPVTILCRDNQLHWSSGAIDADTDSLSYSWAEPLDEVSGVNYDPPNDPVSLPFTGGYAHDKPFPGIQAGTGTAADRLDPGTGQLTLMNPSQGEFNYVVKVTSWRDGQKIAEVYREVGLFIMDCAGNNTAPEILPPFAGSFSDTFQIGQTVSVPIRAVDEDDLQDGTEQTISLDLSSPAFGQNFNDPSVGCPYPPCATLSSAPTVQGTDTVSTQFTWDIECAHLSAPGNDGAGAYKTYVIPVTAKDDHCSVPGWSRRSIRITIENEDAVPSPELNCVSVQGNDVELTWTALSGSHPAFQGYVIYRSDQEGGLYTAIDTVTNLGTSTYTDGGGTGGTDAFYFIRTLSGCQGQLLAASSDTLQRIDLDVSDPNNGVAILEWNELSPSSGPPNNGTGQYRIYKEHPVGNWELIDSVPYGTTSYSDTIMVCSDSLTYRIGIPDHDRGCESLSNLDGGNFSDVIAPSVPEIDRVSVDTSVGKATIEWTASPEPDTEGYYILQIVGGSEIPIDTVWGRNNTSYLYDNSNASIIKENFAVVAFDSCYSGTPPRPNTSTRGDIHNTILLEGNKDRCSRRVQLNWNSYKNWDSGVKHYRIFFLESGSSPLYIGMTQEGDTSMWHGQVPVNKDICYVVQAVSNDGTTAISNKRCLFMDIPEPPDFHYLSTASALPGNEGIEVRSLVDPAAEDPRFRLERMSSDGSFEGLGTYQGTGGTGFSVQDTSVDPAEGPYTYRITALDSCGNEILSSNTGQSVHLRASATREPPVNVLQWTHYEGWEGNISAYEVHRIDRKKGVDQLVETLSPQRRSFEHNVSENVEEENGRYCYYVRAIESGNPRGQNEIARSNEACGDQEPYIWVPNAYIVGGTSRSFNAVTGHVRKEDFSLEIYDRWGKRLYRTEDPDEGWKGETDGGDRVPEGVYIYRFSFKTSYGKRIEKNGSVTLIREKG